MGDDENRHGRFVDVIGKRPRTREMVFDVLYFPPISPIGMANRKGKNNALTALPGDVGSPYAIGGKEGGHDAVHPELGNLDDFKQMLEAARAHGLEIALDFAVQCSPDHPWLKEHPTWFAWRPDGTLRYAENPPKKYQDIVNPDFYAQDAKPGLWLALRDVLFPPELLGQYARYQPAFPATLGARRLCDPRRARRDAFRFVGRVQRFRVMRSGRAAEQRGISRLGEISDSRVGLAPAGEYRRGNHRVEPDQEGESGAAFASRRQLPSRSQRQHPVLRESECGARQRRACRDQSRSVQRTRRGRGTAVADVE